MSAVGLITSIRLLVMDSLPLLDSYTLDGYQPLLHKTQILRQFKPT